jgi:hypothetical protein
MIGDASAPAPAASSGTDRRSPSTVEGVGYFVELRVWGRTLDPAAVTRETGLHPCRAWLAGCRLDAQVQEEGLWAFDGEGPRRWDSLEDGLAYLLDRVEPFSSIFNRYRAAQHTVAWWCGHSHDRLDSGRWLSGRLLARLAAFRADLFIESHADDDAGVIARPSG